MHDKLKTEDVNRLVHVLADVAYENADNHSAFFRDLVSRANLPKNWVHSLGEWGKDTRIAARRLITWAESKGQNPNNKDFTTLGSILQVLLEEVGSDIGRIIVALIVRYQLYLNPKLIDELIIGFQIPVAPSNITLSPQIGPAFSWQGPTEELILQRWFKPEPNFLDVGFLIQAIERAASVCRVETENREILGTGFLINDNMLLTNYHVLQRQPSDELEAIKTLAQTVTLRFGCFTASTGKETAGQTFRLDRNQPIIQCSPVGKLDYALLRVEDTIKNAQGVTKSVYDIKHLPNEQAGLNILQHPEGETMKIALSSNGVTKVNYENGLIQYVTKTASGSSGSPCFNDDWKLVGLHHAEQATAFGAIREGILFHSIYQEIKDHLGQ